MGNKDNDLKKKKPVTVNPQQPNPMRQNDPLIRPGQGKENSTNDKKDKELDTRSNKGRNKNSHP